MSEIKIQQARNGLILNITQDEITSTLVFDYGDSINSDREKYDAIRAMFYAILEEIKPNYKHATHRIDIAVIKQ